MAHPEASRPLGTDRSLLGRHAPRHMSLVHPRPHRPPCLPLTRRHKRAASSHLHVRSHILAFPHVHGPGGCPCCAHESVYGTKREDAPLSSRQLCEHRCVPSPHAHSSRGSRAWRGAKGLSNQRLPLAWASRSWTRHELGAGIRFFLRTGKAERETCDGEGWTAGRRPRSPASWNCGLS